MKLLVVAALVAVAAADSPRAGVQYGTPPSIPLYQFGGQSKAPPARYGSTSSSSYGLKSRRKPFESTLKPVNSGYSSSNGGYKSNNGGYSSQSNRSYNSQSNEGYSSQSNGGYSSQSNGGYSSQSNGGYTKQSSESYTPRYSGSSVQQSSRGYSKPEPTPAPQPYSFSYDVLDVLGNDYGAAEESNGEQVQGQYSVLLPDGRLQTVSYSVQGDSGFVADVQYEGEARFLGADGEEQGRSSVTRGAGPTGGYRYGAN